VTFWSLAVAVAAAVVKQTPTDQVAVLVDIST
jgi:hypothetical protein